MTPEEQAEKFCGKCDEGWVCENHPELGWPSGCECGAGAPCTCNPLHGAEEMDKREAGKAAHCPGCGGSGRYEDYKFVMDHLRRQMVADWQPIDGAEAGAPVFVGWEGAGFQAAVGHREGDIWVHFDSDASVHAFDQQPTHFMPMIYSPGIAR